jgi:hypothetical protein
MEQVTLYDWLNISRDDKLNNLLSRQQDREYHVRRIATIDHTGVQAKKQKKQEFDALPKKPSKSSQLRGKRENTDEEMRSQGLFPKVKSDRPTPKATHPPIASRSVTAIGTTPPKGNPIQEMLRRMRQGQSS